MRNNLFVINYKLRGVPKSFIIRSKSMQNADAWHWASCDAGVAPIPRPGRPPLKMVSKPQAEKIWHCRCHLASQLNVAVRGMARAIDESASCRNRPQNPITR